ncbi:MAG: M24 family metallopeptidase [Alphaproteobacteria bacterium]|nr:M24 family metallopeptidase [Alphaproteobacteria bacterium]
MSNSVECSDTEVDQQRVYRTMAALAASGCTPQGTWLQLFRTDPEQSLGRNLVQLLARIRKRQAAQLLTPAPHDRLEDLRGCLEAEGLDGLILGHDDEILNEYVTPGGERLRWLTGFRGSAGMVLVLPEQAYLFVDGRYTLQAAGEVDPHFVQVVALQRGAIAEKISAAMPAGARWQLGIDPNLFSAAAYRRLEQQMADAEAELCDVARNPVDFLWKEQPPAPFSPITRVELADHGAEPREKLDILCGQLRDKHCDCLVVQAPEDILWLLNIRAADIDTAPLCLSKMIVHAEGSIDWFLSAEKLSHAEGLGAWSETYLHPEEHFFSALNMLAEANSRVWIDPERVSARVTRALEAEGAQVYEAQDPLWRLAACLNATECAGARTAHLRDGCALVDFMAELAVDLTPCQESDLVQRLSQHRAEQDGYEQDSFHAIVAVRGNSAQCHYRPIPDADDRVRWGDIVLIDSGGHYRSGTTDVTRVLAYDQGDVPLSAEFCRHYTLVLQSLIAISETRFPEGTSGMALDAVARRPLWQQGLDYDHGTGHGVGSNSMVHFGPQRIAKVGSAEPLQPGMVVSLEPGLYFAHRYGIRLENLGLVVADPAQPGWLRFENLTLVPFVHRMIMPEMLSVAELAWLNDYHAGVYRHLARNLSPQSARWLAKATRIITL